MGGNGSYSRGLTRTEEGRAYQTIYDVDDNIKIIERKNKKLGIKLPEESHTPGRIYAVVNKTGSDIKSIAIYGQDARKIYEIHTDDHRGLKPHWHPWSNGHPEKDTAYPLDAEKKKILEKIRNFER